MWSPWLGVLAALVVVAMGAEAGPVPLTKVKNAAAMGAACLDGTPPAYHFEAGSGAGVNKWMILIEGGGWCTTFQECSERTQNFRGSSDKMETLSFSGILGSSRKNNPDFYNWNRVKVRYCDGSSFTGNVPGVKNNLYFRGEANFKAVMTELLQRGMNKAENAILSGCSAGGLATILHCDAFRGMLPRTAKAKCVSDAGFFINEKDASGTPRIENFFKSVVELHNSVLPTSCTLTPRHLCFFPENVLKTMTTPLYMVNAAYDSWQIKNILTPDSGPGKKEWAKCKLNLKDCSSGQRQQVEGFREKFLQKVKQATTSPNIKAFINSCYAHCQLGRQVTWLQTKSPRVGGKSISTAVADWYFDRSPSQLIDTQLFPDNPTCVNTDDSD